LAVNDEGRLVFVPEGNDAETFIEIVNDENVSYRSRHGLLALRVVIDQTTVTGRGPKDRITAEKFQGEARGTSFRELTIVPLGEQTNLLVRIAPSVRYFYIDRSSPEVFDSFERDGMVFLRGTFSEADVAKMAATLAENPSARVSRLTKNVEAEVFLQDRNLKALLNKIFTRGERSEGFHLTTYSSNTLRKTDPVGTVWHVDYPYHDLPYPYPDGQPLGVQVNVALTDFTVENGATMYVPGSHRSHRFPGPDVERYNVRHMVVPKGTIIIYRGDVWHAQGVNRTDKPRSALLANFAPLFVPAKSTSVVRDCSFTSFVVNDGKLIYR
jgi:hypothetical protein